MVRFTADSAESLLRWVEQYFKFEVSNWRSFYGYKFGQAKLGGQSAAGIAPLVVEATTAYVLILD